MRAARARSGVVAVAVCGLLIAAAPAGAAEQVVADAAGDSPAAPWGGVDVRDAALSVAGGSTSVRVRWAVTPTDQQQPPSVATIVWLDVDRDAQADYSLLVSGSGAQLTWRLHATAGGEPGCQPVAGTLIREGTAQVAAAGGLEEWQVSFPTADVGGATRFTWALLAYPVPPNVDGQTALTYWDAVPDAASGGGQSPDDRRCGPNLDRVRADLAHGALFEEVSQPQPVPPPAPSPTPTPQPPVAVLRLAEPATVAGTPLALDASGSRDPDGRIIAFEWDWNGDGRYEANTGKRPSAIFVFPTAGTKTIGLRVTDDSGMTSESRLSVNLSDPIDPGCQTKLDLGGLRIAAACVRHEEDQNRYVIQGDPKRRVVILNGVALVGAAQLVLDLKDASLSATGAVSVKLLNTPIGDITLYRAKAGAFKWRMPLPKAPSVPKGPLGAAATHSGGAGYRLATFAAGPGATLPGGFPLTGQVDVLLNTKTFELVIDAHAKLSAVFTVTGDLLLRASRDTGLKLDSLGFHMANARLGIFTLEELDFRYAAPGTGSPPREQDMWAAKLAVALPTPNPSRVRGEVRFVGGRFNYGAAELTVAGGIPIGPGVFLNRFRGEIQTDPLLIGGGLGVSLAAVAQVNGDFTYAEIGSGAARITASGTFSLLGQQLAKASFRYDSNGFVAFAGEFHYAISALSINGGVGAWFEDQPDGSTRWQVEGNVQFHVWKIHGGAAVVVNNFWIAGCGGVDTFLGRVSGYVAYNRSSGRLSGWFGCKLGAYRIVPTRAAAAQAAQAPGARTFTVPRGLSELGLAVHGAGGPPVVRVVAPDGKTSYTTPAGAEDVASVPGRFVAAQLPEGAHTVIGLERPAPGRWRIEPLGGPPVTRLESALPLPSRPVRSARVLGRGRSRVLDYRLAPERGVRVRFVARGRDTTQILGVVTKAKGRIRFTTDDGLGRARRIEATVEVGGAPRFTTTVARFRAPGPVRPGRTGRVSLRRRGSRVVVTWSPAARATRYGVVVRSSDGRRTLLVTRRRRAVVTRVLPSERLNVTVRGEYGPGARPGPARSARLAAARRR